MTQNQQRIMIFLSQRVDARSSDITNGLDMGLSTLQACLPDLYDDDLVQRTKVGSQHVCRYLLTESGQQVAARLARYQQSSQLPAPSMLINKLSGTYTPTHAYSRNNGHTHIQSRGF
jgi:DNA-binding MarR family transcriptional regulator